MRKHSRADSGSLARQVQCFLVLLVCAIYQSHRKLSPRLDGTTAPRISASIRTPAVCIDPAPGLRTRLCQPHLSLSSTFVFKFPVVHRVSPFAVSSSNSTDSIPNLSVLSNPVCASRHCSCAFVLPHSSSYIRGHSRPSNSLQRANVCLYFCPP